MALARAVVCAVVAAVTFAACAARVDGPAAQARIAPTAALPAEYLKVAVTSARGRAVSFAEVLGGRPALVSFWAPWCEPCISELPELERLVRAASPCAVSVLAVAVGETPAAVASFAAANHLTVPQFADEQYTLADALGQVRVPTTVVFDHTQRIAFVGGRLDHRATNALAAAAALQPAAPAARCALAATP